MLTDDQQRDLRDLLLELKKQLDERAQLYALLKATEISDEFARLSRVEVGSMLRIVGE